MPGPLESFIPREKLVSREDRAAEAIVDANPNETRIGIITD
jgi:hypothetical protein